MKSVKPQMLIFLCLVLVSACAGPKPAAAPAVFTWPDAPGPAYWPTRGWQKATPESQGLDSAALVDLLDAVRGQNLDLHSLLVVRNGYLVLEAYFDPYQAGDVHTIESNTKSVIAALTGIAIDQGLIAGVDQALVDFFPGSSIQALDRRKEGITLQHLLSMTPGLDCEDFSSAAQGMYASTDWVQYLLDLPMKTDPGQAWTYCSGAAHLLSAILQQSTGMDARTYANRYLLKPLGIPGITQANWGSDPQAVTNGIAGLYLPPADLAKLGFLYLHKGQWDGEQVVSRAWIEAATREQAYIGPDEYSGGLDRRFGYMFSVFPEQGMYGYLGRAGQELFIVPGQDLVIVFTASLEVGKEASLLSLVNDFILPAVKSQAALPANPQAQMRLESAVSVAAGVTLPVPSLPDIALQVSGVTYQLEGNPYGWADIAFEFQPGSDTATIRMSQAPELIVGLDNRYRLTLDPEKKSRPIGLRGRWLADERFVVEDITLGEFGKTVVTFEFSGNQFILTAASLSFPGEPLVILGTPQD